MVNQLWRWACVYCLFVLTIGVVGMAEGDDPFDAPWNDRSVFIESLVAEERGILDELQGATIYRMKLDIAEDYLSITGQQDVLYTNCEREGLHDVVFRLFPNVAGGRLALTKVLIDETAVQPEYEWNDSVARLPLPLPLLPGESLEIQLEFELSVPTEALVWGPFGTRNGVLSLDAFYPVIPVYAGGQWSASPVPPRGDWTHLDASFYLVEILAPSQLVLAVAGSEVSREETQEHQRVTYAIGPARDFFLAASEHYQTYSETHDGVTITHYFPPGGELQARRATPGVKRMIDLYSELLGPYPYTELDIAATIMGGGSAMEYPGIIAETADIYDRSVVYFGVFGSSTLLEIGIAHEGAHQWFYNVVGNDQVTEPWLDEALAQYCTFLYFSEKSPSTGRNYKRDWWDWNWNRIGREDIPIGLSCWEYANVYTPIVYARAAYFLDALADAMREESPEAFLRDYYRAHKWKIATTESFRQVAEARCECDLTELFDTWVYPED